MQECIEVGNLEAIRDWGHIKDYVRAYWLMINRNDAKEDYVVATN